MKQLSKMSRLWDDYCDRKEYLSRRCLKDVRDIYAERVNMLPLGGNYKRDPRFAKHNWQCLACGGPANDDGGHMTLETQEHISIHCEGYRDLREAHDLSSDDGLLNFYRAVMARRKERQEE